MKCENLSVLLYLLALMIGAAGLRSILQLPVAPTQVTAEAVRTAGTCLSSRDGYLRARLRRAASDNPDTSIDWADADMECDGGPRPDHRGVRVTFAGRLANAGAHVRLVFGIAADPQASARNVPVNVTVIFEDEQQLYSTAGDGKCTIDTLTVDTLTVQGRRIEARGFCTGPATAITTNDALFIDRFDFAGAVRNEETSRP